MYVSPRPPRLPVKLARPKGGLLPVVAFALCAALATAGAVLLREHGVAASQCGDDPATACFGP